MFVLVRTSNASAGEFQDLVADGRPLYRHVAERLAEWAAPHRGESGYSLVGAVVGATYPGSSPSSARRCPGVLFLVPGYGTQGGSAADVAAAFDAEGLGAIVNNSRGLTFAYKRPAASPGFGDDWQAAIAGGRPRDDRRPRRTLDRLEAPEGLIVPGGPSRLARTEEPEGQAQGPAEGRVDPRGFERGGHPTRGVGLGGIDDPGQGAGIGEETMTRTWGELGAHRARWRVSSPSAPREVRFTSRIWARPEAAEPSARIETGISPAGARKVASIWPGAFSSRRTGVQPS